MYSLRISSKDILVLQEIIRSGGLLIDIVERVLGPSKEISA